MVVLFRLFLLQVAASGNGVCLLFLAVFQVFEMRREVGETGVLHFHHLLSESDFMVPSDDQKT